jgi:hypothetical protein
MFMKEIPPLPPSPLGDCVVIGGIEKNVMLGSASNKIKDLRDPETSSG